MTKLDQLISELFDEEAEGLGDETPFVECPSWDSLKHVQLVVGIESRFSVDLQAAEISRLRTKLAVRRLLASRGIDA